MTEFWLIRHGTTHSMLQGIAGRSDVELSERGRAEVTQLARRIASLFPDRAVAWQVAAPAV